MSRPGRPGRDEAARIKALLALSFTPEQIAQRLADRGVYFGFVMAVKMGSSYGKVRPLRLHKQDMETQA